MPELMQTMRARRSVRKYTDAPVTEAQLHDILEAGLLSATGHAYFPWEFVVVRDHAMLQKLTGCRVGSANMLSGAALAIVVLGDEQKADTWIEDCSVVMANMHLMAENLGLGSCWIQVRMREAAEGGSSEDFVRGLLNIPESLRVEAILSVGAPDGHPAPRPEDKMFWNKVRYETY